MGRNYFQTTYPTTHLVFGIYKELSKVNTKKKKNNQIRKYAKDLNDYFAQKNIMMAKQHMK